MSRLFKASVFCILLLALVASITGCNPQVSAEEYNTVLGELENYRIKLQSLESKLAEQTRADNASVEPTALEFQYQALSKNFAYLKTQYDAGNAEIQKVNRAYEELTIQYDDLTKKLDALRTQLDTFNTSNTISVAGIEKAVFVQINEARTQNGLGTLLWKDSDYSWARNNCIQMAELNKEIYQAGVLWRLNFRADGYENIGTLANGALLLWKNDDYSFNQRVLNGQIKYGVVATYKSGNIYYITYMGSSTP